MNSIPMISMTENYTRHENILILPHNTLRVVDAMYALKLYSLSGKPLPDFEVNLLKIISRKKKDLGEYFKITDNIRNEFKNNWYKYYDIAPRTKMYEYIDILRKQKFVDNTTILFSDKKASDNAFDNDYYDGSMEELEKYIDNHKITTLIIDDADIMTELLDRKNINLNNFSFLISQMGYNYEYVDIVHQLMPKNSIYNAQKKAYIEIGMVALFEFDKSVFEKLDNKKKK